MFMSGPNTPHCLCTFEHVEHLYHTVPIVHVHLCVCIPRGGTHGSIAQLKGPAQATCAYAQRLVQVPRWVSQATIRVAGGRRTSFWHPSARCQSYPLGRDNPWAAVSSPHFRGWRCERKCLASFAHAWPASAQAPVPGTRVGAGGGQAST